MPRFLVVLDVDSTLIDNEIVDLLAETAGSHDEVAAITLSAMNGEIDFTQSLHARVATLKGLPESALVDVRSRMTTTRGAIDLIAGVNSVGGRVCALSSGFHDVMDPLAVELGLDRWRANCLEIVDGKLTGNLRGRVIDAVAKETALREWADIYSVPLKRTVVIGDGANDVLMMATAGLAVAFDATSAARDAAHLVIHDRDLSQVLPLLGLRG